MSGPSWLMMPGSKSCNSAKPREAYRTPKQREQALPATPINHKKPYSLFCWEGPLTTYVLAAMEAWTAKHTVVLANSLLTALVLPYKQKKLKYPWDL